MKKLKIAGIIVTAMVGLFLLIAAFLPSHYTVERSIVINHPDSLVFMQVADFNNWIKWNPWTELERTAENIISGPPGSVGAKWSWKGKKIGAGVMEIIEIEPYRLVHSKVVLVEPQKNVTDDIWEFEPTPEGVKVTWRNSGELAYPTGRFFGLFREFLLGGQFEHGLQNLKARCEKLQS